MVAEEEGFAVPTVVDFTQLIDYRRRENRRKEPKQRICHMCQANGRHLGRLGAGVGSEDLQARLTHDNGGFPWTSALKPLGHPRFQRPF